MTRVSGGNCAKTRKKKLFKLAKGYVGSKNHRFKAANETVMRGLANAFKDRKVKKRDFRKLWIVRINAAVKNEGLSYSKFIAGLKTAAIDINRKILAEMAVNNPEDFSKLVKLVKDNLK